MREKRSGKVVGKMEAVKFTEIVMRHTNFITNMWDSVRENGGY